MDDYAGSAQALAATTLRNVLGTRTLGDILSDRVKIAQEMHVGVGGLRGTDLFTFPMPRTCLLMGPSTGASLWRGSR